MLRRRTVGILCATTLVAAAGLLAWTLRTPEPRPLHFWVASDDAATLRVAPDGPRISGWTVRAGGPIPTGAAGWVAARGGSIVLGRAHAPVVEWLMARGLIASNTETYAATQMHDGGVSRTRFVDVDSDSLPPWTEYVALAGPWPGDVAPDDELAGDWEESFRDGLVAFRRTLHADGRVTRLGTDDVVYVWGRLGDALVFGWPAEGGGAGRLSWVGVLSDDGRSYRGVMGETGRRVGDAEER